MAGASLYTLVLAGTSVVAQLTRFIVPDASNDLWCLNAARSKVKYLILLKALGVLLACSFRYIANASPRLPQDMLSRSGPRGVDAVGRVLLLCV